MLALEGWLDAFWAGTVVHLWQSALFVGVIALIAQAMRGASARLLSALYSIGVLKLLLPLPLLGPLSRRLVSTLAGLTNGAAAGTALESTWTTVTVFIHPLGFESVVSRSVHPALLVAASTAWLLVGGVALWRGGVIRRRADDPRSVGLDGLEAVKRTRIRTAIAGVGLRDESIRISRRGIGPTVRGLIHPTIVLPESVIDGLDIEELRAVLLHEREHLLRRDPLRYAVLSVVQSVLWFYPPVWWLARRIRETTEMACDEAVVRAGFPAAIYCRSLARTVSLGLASSPAVSPVGILGHRVSFLKRRLERIRSGRRFEIMTAQRITLALVAVAAAVVSLLPIAPVVTAGSTESGVVQEDVTLAEEVNIPVMLNFKQTDVRKVLHAIASSSGIEIQYVGELEGRFVDLDLDQMPLDDALKRIGALAGLRFRVIGPKTVEVRSVAVPGRDGVSNPVLMPQYKVNPDYPESAREDRVQGRVILQALIDRFGFVNEIEALNSDPKDYRPFIDSAIDAVSQWRYEPATKDGEPVDVYFTVMVDFELR